MNAFLTGSRAYGTPHENSDIDLAVLVPADLIEELVYLADEANGEEYGDGEASLRFGKLNLLCFSDEGFFGAWKAATDELVARKPVSRAEAVEAIEAKVLAVKNERWIGEGDALAAMEKDPVTGEFLPEEVMLAQPSEGGET